MGIDPSLSSTGVAFIGDDGSAWSTTIQSKPVGDDPLAMTRRIVQLRNRILTLVRDAEPDLVLLEKPVIVRVQGAVLERGGLFHHLVHGIDSMHIPQGFCIPQPIKKFAADNGGANKFQVMQGVNRMFPDVELRDDNEADALAAAAMAAVRGRHEHLPFRIAERHRLAIRTAGKSMFWPPEFTHTPPVVGELELGVTGG